MKKWHYLLIISTLLSVIVSLIGIICHLAGLGFLTDGLFSLAIAIFTVSIAYYLFLKEQESNIKKKEERFKSKLNNLLIEIDHNIDVPQQHSSPIKFKDIKKYFPVTIEIDDRILLSCISELTFYTSKEYQELLKDLSSLLHITKVYKTNQNILLYSGRNGYYELNSIDRSIQLHINHSSDYRARSKIVAQKIMKITPEINLDELSYLKKEFQ